MSVYLMNSEQIGISEQLYDDQKVPYYQVRLLKNIIKVWMSVKELFDKMYNQQQKYGTKTKVKRISRFLLVKNDSVFCQI